MRNALSPFEDASSGGRTRLARSKSLVGGPWRAAFASVLFASGVLFACSDDSDSNAPPPRSDASSDAPNDGTTGDGGGTDATNGNDAGTDTGTDAQVAVRCSQAQFDQVVALPVGGDYTAESTVEITFPMTASPSQYTPHCLKVKKGTSVSFKGKFSFHPLEPEGGDTPTPIPSQGADVADDTVSVAMTTEGTFGFQCSFHPTVMFGAIQVVP